MPNAMTLAEAKAATITDECVNLTDRNFSRWVPAGTVSCPTEMQDITWFYDAANTQWTREPYQWVDPRDFGAQQAVGVDDARAWAAVAWWCSMQYAHLVEFYNTGAPSIISTGSFAWWPNDAVRTAILSVPHTNPHPLLQGICFAGVRGLTIRGHGDPVIQMADSGCTSDASALTSQGIFNLWDCQDVVIEGVKFDGNRARQFHSVGARTKVNHNLVIWYNCVDIRLSECSFTSSGTLTDDPDKAGDAVYIRNGFERIYIDQCTFRDRSRMDITVERGIDTTDTLNIGNGLYITDADSDATIKSDGGTSYAFFDAESWSELRNVDIRRCKLKGQCRISFGGGPNKGDEQFFDNIHVDDNQFDLRGTVNPLDITFLVAFGGAYTYNDGTTTVDALRSYHTCSIDNNRILLDKPYPNDLIALRSANFIDFSVCDNRVFDQGGTLTAALLEQGLCTFEGHPVRKQQREWSRVSPDAGERIREHHAAYPIAGTDQRERQ